METDIDKIEELAKICEGYTYEDCKTCRQYDCDNRGRYYGATEMAKWKNKQIDLLLDSLDHAYLQTDGTYGDLSLEVVDKIKYLKSLRDKRI